MSDQPFTVLFVGRLDPDKNIPFLMQAFQLFHLTCPHAELCIVGRGYIEKKLKKLSRSLGIAEVTRFVGHVQHERLSSYYESASVFVLPSTNDAFGIVVAEAMYFSLPVIVPRGLISATDLVVHQRNGFIVDPTSAEGLADALRILQEDDERRARMGRESAKRAVRFQVGIGIDRIEQCYLEVINEK